MAGNTNNFGLWGSGGVPLDVRETVWTTATDGDTSIHIANPSILGNPDIDASSANFVVGDFAVAECTDIINPGDASSHEEATYLADSVHVKGRP